MPDASRGLGEDTGVGFIADVAQSPVLVSPTSFTRAGCVQILLFNRFPHDGREPLKLRALENRVLGMYR